VACRHPSEDRSLPEEPAEPLLTHDDVTTILLWMADVIAELRAIHHLLKDEDGEEEEE
jgi:hypothetical protein